MKKLLFLCLSWLLFHTSGQAQDEMSFTWDLTTNSWASQSPDLVVWESSFVTMESIGGNEVVVNETLGGGNNKNTKFPEGATIRFTPKDGVNLSSIEFFVSSSIYNNYLTNIIVGSEDLKKDLIPEEYFGNLRVRIKSTAHFPIEIPSNASIRLTAVKIYYLAEPFTPTMTHVNDLYWSTMYLDYPVDIPSGVNAYYITVEDNVAHLNTIDGVIPANTGVILRSETVGPFEFNQTTSAATTDVSDNNKLVGWISDRVVSGQSGNYYALNKKDDVVGFYIPKGTQDGTFTAKANKAYLKLDHSESVKELSIVFDDAPDGIETIVEQTNSSQDSYNLQGMKVGEGYKGLMISNGRKVYRK